MRPVTIVSVIANSSTRRCDRSSFANPPRVSISTSELGVQYQIVSRSSVQCLATAAGNDAVRELTG